MTQEKRFGLSAAQKSEMWRRWKAGRSLHEIGRAFGKEHSSIRRLVLHAASEIIVRHDFVLDCARQQVGPRSYAEVIVEPEME